ncbi:ankyrin repeat, SAM and basic leucine zipper domain-containing protein 1 isoform X2 [Ascaphus truei]|uniref:ankyrin repeat, SAM and basic leucine zipper domain-containing protein 1 isoform X2 n=1 Tax=Ascaphus truei TaxID=8439 RepID=UPI003F59D9D0
MATGRLNAVPGGGESSDSDEYWDMWEPPQRGKKLKKTVQPESKEDSLKKALTSGDVNLVEELLLSGVNVECCFQFGWTPLMYAASVANLEMVRVLLDKGANASFEKDKFTVLMSACIAHSSEEKIVKCVELLLSRNSDPNVACRKRMTPIMFAAREGHAQVVALLVAHGADINAHDEDGYTALTWASKNGHKNTVLKLLELGADRSLATKHGITPGEMARKHNHLEIFSILSFSANLNQEKQNVSKEEAIYKYLKGQPDSVRNYTSSYTASGDLEVFLHGMDLEHLTDLFKDNDITLRELLTLEEEELKKAGITNAEDCNKIIAAVKEIQVEDIKLETSPTFLNLESSSDEFFAFLLKLNRQCNCLTRAVENINDQIPLNPNKIVLEWDSTQNFSSVCEDIVASITDLGKEMFKLQNRLHKNDQKNAPCRVPPLEEPTGWRRYKLRKRTTVTVLSLGFIILLVKLNGKKI